METEEEKQKMGTMKKREREEKRFDKKRENGEREEE